MLDTQEVQLVLQTNPDGRKKAYARLSPEHDALDVANKAGYI